MQKLGPGLLVALALLLAAVPTAAAQRPDPRIINGDPTTADGQYPWTVALVSPDAPDRQATSAPSAAAR